MQIIVTEKNKKLKISRDKQINREIQNLKALTLSINSKI